jgi:hypothetical protein
VRKHIARAAKIAVRGHIDWQEPKYILDPSPQVIRDVLDDGVCGQHDSGGADVCGDHVVLGDVDTRGNASELHV